MTAKTITVEGNTYDIRESHHLEYENDAENSHKFWETNLLFRNNTWSVYTRWGKIGTNGQDKLTLCSTESEAVRMAATGVNEKTRKGYIHTSETVKAATKAPVKKTKIVEVETEWDIS